MISSSEKGTSLKLEVVRPSDPKSELWNVDQSTVYTLGRLLIELNSHCTKRRQMKSYVVLLYPAFKALLLLVLCCGVVC